MLILASASPRRQELLKIITTDFSVVVPDVDERVSGEMNHLDMVKEIAFRKAKKVFDQNPTATVIGSDTIVVVGEKVLGKPKDEEDAYKMLRTLSGRWHIVDTGVCIISRDKTDIFSVATKVEFMELSDEEIWDYIAGGEPMDKAGSYGINGSGARFIRQIKGDYYGVMGLPINALYQKLKEMQKPTE